VQDTFHLGICASRSGACDTSWHIWIQFCHSLNLDPTLPDITEPVPILQVFAHRYRLGQLSPSRTPVHGRTVGDAVRAVGQTLSQLGLPDPRLLPSGKLILPLSRQLASYTKADPPPYRVRPIPITILQATCNTLRLSTHPRQQAIADMITLGFYFLLRPAEYAHTSNPDSTPFRLQDVTTYRHHEILNHSTCPVPHLDATTFICLEFTNQKNGVRGERIGLSRSGNPAFCPVVACINRIKHLRLHRAPPQTPLYTIFAGRWLAITTTNLTQELRATVATIGHTVGLNPDVISVQSLHASGAMALLCANVDTDRIRLLGRWRSDEMLRYLHIQAYPVVAHLAPSMLQHGHFSLLPHSTPQPLLQTGIGGSLGPVGYQQPTAAGWRG
jgi:hypothetical protein